MKLSVIIVNYNVKYFLEQCLCSVKKACKNLEAEIFVVDNHSTDGSREYLESRFPGVHFKWNEANAGFAKANNSVLPETSGEYVLFLNPDTIVPEDCFEKCIGFFSSNPSCGALGVHMMDGSGRFLKESKRSFPSPGTSFFKITGFAKLFPSSPLFAGYYASHLPEHKSNEVDVLAGAFLMVTRIALQKVQGFDERFFMYAEDIDLCYRLQKEGFKNYYFPFTSIIHFKGESTQKSSRHYITHFYGAMQLFVQKHYKEKKVLYLFMSLAIACSKLLAMGKRFLLKHFHAPAEKEKAPPTTLIVAGQEYFNRVIQLIKYAKKPLLIAGRIAAGEDDKDPATGKLDTLPIIIKKNNIQNVLFCEGALSFLTIIQQMKELSGKTGFLLHANNSLSVVGSSHKDLNGIFITKA